MSRIHRVSHALVLALAGNVFTTSARAAAPPSFDVCLENLRRGPDSFTQYLCLGTPGLPERPSEVRAVLEQVLRRKPREPHARLYLGLMRVYQRENIDEAEFTEPLRIFEQKRKWGDVFFAQLATVEQACLGGWVGCEKAEPRLAEAERIAETIGDPSLKRLAAIAQVRWNVVAWHLGAARVAEKRLDGIPEEPPSWLLVLEAATRAQLAATLGDDLRVRELYSSLLTRLPTESVARAAALASVASAMARLAWQGLAERGEAEGALREALVVQRRLNLRSYNSPEVGTERTSVLLALLTGAPSDVPSSLSDHGFEPFKLEVLLRGGEQKRAEALRIARSTIHEGGPLFLDARLARAHVEFWAGSQEEAIGWARRLVPELGETRRSVKDEDLRMRADSDLALAYQTLTADLLETGEPTPERLGFALEVTEQLRARVLLERLAERESARDGAQSLTPILPELQSALSSDEALVSFMVWAPRPNHRLPYTLGHSAALVVTKNAIRAVRIAQGEVLQPAVKAWTGLLRERQGGTERGSRRLYEEIMKPVMAVLPPGVRSLTIVPDGPLHRVPFDALSETGSAPFLAQRFSIALVPSASVWLRLRNRSHTPGGLALAFANTPEGPAVIAAETRGEVSRGRLGALLHAREEAQAAVDAFPSGSRLLTGAEATPDHLAPAELAKASLIHFAAHGVADDHDPGESFLLLAPAARTSGKLRVTDIPRFDWNGKTVVLSACDTSVGAFRSGEGVLSLARGFFAGGASTVVATLSQVRDDDQQAFFRAFYRELRHGVSVGEAMTEAKRSLIQIGLPIASWANVIVLGDATVRPRARDASPPPMTAVLILSAAAVVTMLGVRRARRRRTRPPAQGPAY